MTREERNQLLADLRAAGVRLAVLSAAGGLLQVEFLPQRVVAAPAADEDRPLPKPKRTLDQRLMDPLGIGEKPEAQ